MNRKKILHVTQALGGVRTFIESIINFADPFSWEFVIIAPRDEDFERYCKARSIKYISVNIGRGFSPVNDISVLFKLISIYRREKPDAIHTHSAKGGFLGRLAAKIVSLNVLYTPNALAYLSFTGIQRMIFYLLEYMARGWTTKLVAVSYSEANRAIFELGYKKSSVEVVLNSISIEPEVSGKDYSKIFNIGMIGRLTYQKNPLLFLEVAKNLLVKYPFLQFSILGAGLHDHLEKEITQYLQENHLLSKINILSWGDSNTSNNFLNNTDVFVMTSVFEGLPFSLLEAMAKGIPCVASKADGNSDVIQNGENGFACLSSQEFCNKIGSLIESEELRRNLGRAGRNYVEEHHDIRKNIRQIEDIYDRVTTQKNN